MNDIIYNIKSFALLESGWNYGEGEVPSENIIFKAINVYNYGIEKGYKGNATPMNEGILVDLFIDSDFFCVGVHENHFSLTWEKGIGTNYRILLDEENISWEGVKNVLEIYSKGRSIGLFK